MHSPLKRKNKSTETVPFKDLMASILDKVFKTTVLKMLRELKEDVEKVKKMIYEQNGNININKEIENLGKKEILELKSTIAKMKNWLEGFKGRLEQAEERISKLGNMTVKIIESEE